jgi:hypothetical protein
MVQPVIDMTGHTVSGRSHRFVGRQVNGFGRGPGTTRLGASPTKTSQRELERHRRQRVCSSRREAHESHGHVRVGNGAQVQRILERRKASRLHQEAPGEQRGGNGLR